MPPQNTSMNASSGSSSAAPRHRTSALTTNPTFERPRAPPIAVQSMLRTTTEMGNVLPMTRSVGPNSRPGSRLQSTRPRSGSFDTSFASALHHLHSPRHRPDRRHNKMYPASAGQQLSRHNTVQSNLSSYVRSPRNRHSNPKNYPSHHRGFTNPRLPPKTIRKNRSALVLRSDRDAASRYSSSSSRPANTTVLSHHSYSSRNGRDGGDWYRRVSDTLDDNRNSIGSAPGLATSYVGDHASLSRGGRRTFFSASGSISESRFRHIAAPTSLQNGANSATPLMTGTANADRLHRASMTSRSECSQPRYYDYSESFLEKDHATSENAYSIRSHFIDHAILRLPDDVQRVQPLRDIHLGSPLFPAELSAEHTFRNEESLASRLACKETSNSCSVSQVVSKLNLSELSADCNDHAEPERYLQERFELEANVRRFSAASRRTCNSSRSGIFFPNGDKSQRDLPLLVARVHSPVPDAVTKMSKTGNIVNTSFYDLDNHDYSLNLEFQSSCEPSSLMDERPRTSPIDICRGELEVISPQPKRPISSQSRRQFKQIIEIGKDITNVVSSRSDEVLNKDWFSSVSMLGHASPIDRSHLEGTLVGQKTTPGCSSKDVIVLGAIQTPDHMIEPGIALSHGKSTVDLLLENHIMSLGLMPDLETSSDSSSLQVSTLEHTSQIEDFSTASENVQILTKSQRQLLKPSTSQSSSLSSHARMNMKPQRLFANQDGTITAFPEPVVNDPEEKIVLVLERFAHPLHGWQTLPSDSHTSRYHDSSKQTLLSGEIADIDTDLYPLGHRIWRSSQLSLPTTAEGHISVSPFDSRDHQLRRSRSEVSTRQECQHRRRMKVHIQQQSERYLLHKSLSIDKPEPQQTCNTLPSSEQCLHATQKSELNTNQICDKTASISDHRQYDDDGLVPNRWSGIIAAMPMPGTGQPIFPRMVSTKTHTSRQSARTQASLAERLNSTRQRSQVPQLGNVVPRLAPPDLGPLLDASTLDLSVPYAEASPSTIPPSKHETQKSFFNHSPPSKVQQKSGKRQYGLRPLQTRRHGSSIVAMPARTGLPMRNGIPISAIGPSNSGLVNKHSERNVTFQATQPLHASDSNYPRRTPLGRFRDWWKRQCVHKAITTRRNRMM